MGNTRSKRKRLARLFEAFAANLSAFDSSQQNIFACPLCLRGFTQDALESEGLTEEHIISRELGGRLITLTCKECNSRGGAELDVHLVNEFRALDKIGSPAYLVLRGRAGRLRRCNPSTSLLTPRRSV
jgi:5-methylcytosine-specific restriction endonuclease McrA